MALAICTKCFGLTDLYKRSQQRCSCEEQLPPQFGIVDCPSGFHLCWICARAKAGGQSRWSWEVCDKCRSANEFLAKTLGVKAELGRHSIMNGIGIPIQKKLEAGDPAIEEMLSFIKKVGQLSEWGHTQIKVLYEAMPEWAGLTHVSLEGWRKKYRNSSKTSLEAVKKYWGL